MQYLIIDYWLVVVGFLDVCQKLYKNLGCYRNNYYFCAQIKPRVL